MSLQRVPTCPYCLAALVGLCCLIGLPDLAYADTPFGKAVVPMLVVPILCALLRRGLRLGALTHRR